jgi:hypothetical protein
LVLISSKEIILPFGMVFSFLVSCIYTGLYISLVCKERGKEERRRVVLFCQLLTYLRTIERRQLLGFLLRIVYSSCWFVCFVFLLLLFVLFCFVCLFCLFFVYFHFACFIYLLIGKLYLFCFI